jgi:hypothetical protein
MMPSPAQRLALLLTATIFGATDARALIIYGADDNDDNNLHKNFLSPNTLPPNGAPSCNVVKIGDQGSGIYLGNGYVLTANHVGLSDNGIVINPVINGVTYTRDPAFDPVQISEDVPTTLLEDFTDLKIVKIVGLPPLPVVQKLPINHSSTADLAATTTLIGWGQGKGSVVQDQGWNGGGTFALRWGTNSAPGSYTQTPFQNYGYLYDALYINFNRNLGPDTAHLAFLDSGSALLQQIGGVWTVSGIATLGYAAYYDNNLSTPGDQPNPSVFVRLHKYAHLLRYENWANTKLGNPAASLTADPDGDGVKNVLEYAFHTDPNAASSAALPQVGQESGYVTLTYTQLMSATDLTYAVEQSSDLSNPLGWGPATVIEELVSTNGVTRVVKAKVALGIATQKYLRLSVTKLP